MRGQAWRDTLDPTSLVVSEIILCLNVHNDTTDGHPGLIVLLPRPEPQDKHAPRCCTPPVVNARGALSTWVGRLMLAATIAAVPT